MATATPPFFCGNWKLNGSIAESLALATDVRNGVATLRDVDVAVAPSFTALYAVAKRLEDGPVAVAAQDCFWEEKGAFTGEVARRPAGRRRLQVRHHRPLGAAAAVRRDRRGREPEGARGAARRASSPIICVGETLAERDAGETIGRVQAQLDAALADIDDAALERVVIAYEPVWAIGTGRNATPAQAQEVHHFIRTRIARARGGGRGADAHPVRRQHEARQRPRAHGRAGRRRRPGRRRVAVRGIVRASRAREGDQTA